jgi:hypothetical protein
MDGISTAMSNTNPVNTIIPDSEEEMGVSSSSSSFIFFSK